MGKKQKTNQEAIVEEAIVEIASTEIQITSNENLNFRNFRIKKGEIVVISDDVFKKLCEETPNLKAMLTKGVIELVN